MVGDKKSIESNIGTEWIENDQIKNWTVFDNAIFLKSSLTF